MLDALGVGVGVLVLVLVLVVDDSLLIALGNAAFRPLDR
jgi:hypothetical protein